ncbi:MAG: hypothetical protein JW982_05415 [Spirochaetes bacterium]|nr:hypothetical protein [Spirochaetota bacterium]
MLKKAVLLVLFVLFSVFLSCGNKPEKSDLSQEEVKGSGKYPEAVSAMKKMINAQEKYIKELQSVKSADDIVKAVNNYVDEFTSLATEMENISAKYPELADESVSDPEIEALTKRLEELSIKTATESGTKLMKYMNDPKVQEAIGDLTEKMGSLDM